MRASPVNIYIVKALPVGSAGHRYRNANQDNAVQLRMFLPMCMSSTIRRWRLSRRYRDTARQLHALTPRDLSALGIPRADIDRLACAAARSEFS